MGTTLTVKVRRPVTLDLFAGITDVAWEIAYGNPATFTFDGVLDQDAIDACRERCESVDDVDAELRARAKTALTTNRDYLAIAAPTNAQAAAQIKALTRQNIGIIRQLLGLLDGLD
jgi:hypothetical protein